MSDDIIITTLQTDATLVDRDGKKVNCFELPVAYDINFDDIHQLKCVWEKEVDR